MCILQLLHLMPKYNRRTQILLSEEQYGRLMRAARARGESMGSLIREAVDRAYGDDRKRKLKLVEEIAAMNLPVSDWDVMEEEIIRGHVAGLQNDEESDEAGG